MATTPDVVPDATMKEAMRAAREAWLGPGDRWHEVACAVLAAALPDVRRAVAEWAQNDVRNVREYGERGTPYHNGAAHLAARIAREVGEQS